MKQCFQLLFLLLSITLVVSCQGGFSKADKEIIFGGIDNNGKEELLHLYVVDNPSENAVLRDTSDNLSVRAIGSEAFSTLTRRMITTVKDSTVDGVGIAAPQIGINKRVVAVQRFDKEGEPFEIYPNISIISYSDSTRKGFEGCLSVPNRREEVVRSKEIVISYIDPEKLEEVEERIVGFTAVIFQHEVDHLVGKVYTDYVDCTEK